MELAEAAASKKTIYVGGLGEDVNEEALHVLFSTFGDVMDVQLPLAAAHPQAEDRRHRGFAFVTFGAFADAQDAIDNMDMNEFRGRVLKVNMANAVKVSVQPQGNRAVWESEEWLKQYSKPLQNKKGGQQDDAPQEGEEDAPAEAEADDEPMEE